MTSSTPLPESSSKKPLGHAFWKFHLIFWGVVFVAMFLSGLSQSKSFEVSLLRNVLYGVLGLLSTLLLVPWFDKFRLNTPLNMLIFCVSSSYLVGNVVTLLINPITAIQQGVVLGDMPFTYWFGGSLNFTLVTLVWCSFYLAFKHGLSFMAGDEEQKAAQAIASLSSVTNYPEFIALERNKKIFFLPVSSISHIQGAGDYVEIHTDEGEFLKRESLTNMVQTLDPDLFQRVHRSAIVNLRAIQEMEPKGKGDFTLLLKSGKKIAASRSYMKTFTSRFSGGF